MKYYDYSVKDTLEAYFGDDAINKMRAIERDLKFTDEKDRIPLTIFQADERSLQWFLSNYFLKKTELYDDYIAYYVVEGNSEKVFLSFWFEAKTEFNLDPEYAYELTKEWESKGYCAEFLIHLIYYDRDRRSKITEIKSFYSFFLKLESIEDNYYFLYTSESFWNHALGLLYSAIKSKSLCDYECILKNDVVIKRCLDRSSYEIANDKISNLDKLETIADGFTEAVDYLNNLTGATVALVERYPFKDYPGYEMSIISDNNRYIFYVDPSNQLSIIVEEPVGYRKIAIPELSECYIPKVIPMPKIISARALDISLMHAYSIQIGFDNGRVKNYYLHSFDSREIPDSIDVEGYKFDAEVLKSAEIICNDSENGVRFSNGFFIPAHLLYYRSYSQLIPEKTDRVIYENDEVSVKSIYRLPLMLGNVFNSRRAPESDEHFGANYCLIDDCGNRINDYSAYYIDNNEFEKHKIKVTRAESNSMIGYIKEDGNWLVPPIFDNGERYKYDHCVSASIGDRKYLVNELGEIIPVDFEIDTDMFSDNGLCPFNVKRFEGEITYPEEDYFDELKPGLWGYIDRSGKIVIEPQYVFATTFFDFKEHRAFVAKLIDGKPLWGLIDSDGNEIIECKYPNLANHWGDYINYQVKDGGLYGIMDINGNVISKPKFAAIKEYNPKYDMVMAYKKGLVGVVRLSDSKRIVPFEYDYITFEDDYIECEIEPYREDGDSYHYYNYSGERIPYDPKFGSWKVKGGRRYRIDGKIGQTDENGKVIVPFEFDEDNWVDLYLLGFNVTGSNGQYGLKTTSGETILEEKYRSFWLIDDFIVTSLREAYNYDYLDELYYKNGEAIFSDLSRHIRIHNGLITRDTPFGKEYCRIYKKK